MHELRCIVPTCNMECAVHVWVVNNFPLDLTALSLRKHREHEVWEGSFIYQLYFFFFFFSWWALTLPPRINKGATSALWLTSDGAPLDCRLVPITRLARGSQRGYFQVNYTLRQARHRQLQCARLNFPHRRLTFGIGFFGPGPACEASHILEKALELMVKRRSSN